MTSSNIKLLNRLDKTEATLSNFNTDLENICTILLCIMEATCMQIRAEEQEDNDKKGISLMGSKNISAKPEAQEIVLTAEAVKSNFLPSNDFPMPVGHPPQVRHPGENPISINDFKDRGT